MEQKSDQPIELESEVILRVPTVRLFNKLIFLNNKKGTILCIEHNNLYVYSLITFLIIRTYRIICIFLTNFILKLLLIYIS